jgi:hypothetical protein
MGTVPICAKHPPGGPRPKVGPGKGGRSPFSGRLTKEPTMLKSAGHSLLTLVAMGIAGCSVAPPNILHPGPAVVQQGRAQQFDPYPEPEIGGNMAGTRPPDYQQPIPELDRARWTQSANGRPCCPPAGSPVAGYGSPGAANGNPVAGYGSPSVVPGSPVATPAAPATLPGVTPVATGPAFGDQRPPVSGQP